MARYTGPRLKIVRALGIELPGLTRKTPNRDYGPGQHGMKPKRKSGFGVQLMEKQKLRYNYGVSERQMQRLFREAKNSREQTGNKLLELLERRLDNVVFRAGFAPTTVAARQLVSHRHMRLNGRPVTIPSIRVKPGDVISLSDTAKTIPMVVETLGSLPLTRPEWLAFDEAKASATVSRIPDANEVPFPIEVQQIVEYYAIRM
jgi:small subunit ribosomal protein S4